MAASGTHALAERRQRKLERLIKSIQDGTYREWEFGPTLQEAVEAARREKAANPKAPRQIRFRAGFNGAAAA